LTILEGKEECRGAEVQRCGGEKNAEGQRGEQGCGLGRLRVED